METKTTTATNSFPHDSGTRNNEKIIKLRMRHGAAGYGIYFMILERLWTSPGFVSVKDYNIIAFDLRVDAAIVKSIVEDFGLFVFTEDGKYFYSEEFKRQADLKDCAKKRRQKIGKAAAEKRWAKKQEDEQTETTSAAPQPPATANQDKPTAKADPAAPSQEPPATPAQPPTSIDQEVAQLKQDDSWLDSLQCLHHLPKDQLRLKLDDFLRECRASGKRYHQSMADAKHHFNCWLRIIIQKSKAESTYATTNAKRRGTILSPLQAQTKDYGSTF